MILNRRQLWILWIGLGLFVAAFVWDACFSGEQNLVRYKNLIESHLHGIEADADVILKNKEFIDHRLRDKFTATIFKEDLTKLELLGKKPYNFCIFKDKELVFWTRHDILPFWSDMSDTASDKIFSKFVSLKESQFELRYRNYWDSEGQKTVAAALIPIKKMYPSFEGEFLKPNFSASSFIPPSLLLTEAKQKYPILSSEGTVLCHLNSTEIDTDMVHDWGMLCFFILGLFMIGIVGDCIAKQMLQQYSSPVMGVGFFIAILTMLRLCIHFIQNSNLLPFLTTDAGNYHDAIFVMSLPELVISTSFLFWFAVFFNKDFKIPDYKDLHLWLRWTLGAAFYCIIVLLIILCIGVCNDLVTNWDNLLAFDSLSDFNGKSLLALLSVGVMMLSIFLITHKLVIAINDLNLNKVQHFFAVDIAVGLGLMMFQTYPLNLPTPMYVIFIFIYILIFQNFITYEIPSLIWLVLWVLIFSAIQAFFIARFNGQKEAKIIYEYAYNLAREQDIVAENRIKFLCDNIANDPMIQTASTFPIRLDVDPKKIRSRIDDYFKADEYLSHQYSYKFLSFYQNNVALIAAPSEDSLNLYSWNKKYEKGVAFDKTVPNLRFWTNKKGAFAYMALIKVPAMPNNPIFIGIEFKREDMLSSRVFTELLVNRHYKALNHLNDYTYAIYKNGVRTEQSQTSNYPKLIDFTNLPPRGKAIDTTFSNRNELVYQNTEGVVVKIGKDKSVSSQVLALWMFIILILFVLLFILALTNHFVKFLPDVVGFNFSFSFASSLRNRILIPSIVFVLFSYVAIFLYTTRYFKNIDDKYYTADLESKSNSIINSIAKDISEVTQLNDSTGSNSVKNLLQKYSQSHQIAIHYFDAKGEMYATTETNIYDKGIISKRMNNLAFLKLKSGTEKDYKTDENIGDFHYKTAYFSIQDTTNRLIGFLELPFYSLDRNMRVGISEIWTYSATILTILFIVGICVIYLQTNKNIQPLQNIADHLLRLELGKKAKNERITSWNKKDEIGILIEAYNSKVTQLEETYTRITEIEREGAWRDMAKQVAHEIRNPLTPMKLVVQHLEMIRHQRPENLEEYLIRSNKVLLDQIDNLEKIVSEFANFAKMPQKAVNEMFIINDLVASVGNLFGQLGGGKKVVFSLNVPEEQYTVYADRTLLTGALNNLVKNAMQAIPEDREGRIIVSLYRRNTRAIIRISDNGMGIPKEIQDKIFTPNFTTKQYGNGIGLLITKNIIQSVNGKIHYESVENEGTDFYVELDIHDVEKTSIPDFEIEKS